jgi:hypothetical protein
MGERRQIKDPLGKQFIQGSSKAHLAPFYKRMEVQIMEVEYCYENKALSLAHPGKQSSHLGERHS